MGGLWIGAVLLAGATSLPELATDISAVRLGDPDLAMGDLFGSSMANMLILGIIVHIYAAIWVKGTVGAMTRGTVARAWAKKHHPGWYREVSGNK